MELGRVSELWRYPVSSLAGEATEALELTGSGVVGDRLWGLVDRSSGTIGDPDRERRWRPLPLMRARLADGVPEVSMSPGDWLALPAREADEAASALLGFPACFRPHRGSANAVPPRYDIAPLHLVTTASLAHLAALLSEPAEADARRFRPNLVIETGAGAEGFVEKGWVGKALRLGAAELTVVEPCARCSFTALAQQGLKFEPEILRQVAAHGGGGFGVYCAILKPGTIRRGDTLALL